jgi:hypothetical protein
LAVAIPNFWLPKFAHKSARAVFSSHFSTPPKPTTMSAKRTKTDAATTSSPPPARAVKASPFTAESPSATVYTVTKYHNGNVTTLAANAPLRAALAHLASDDQETSMTLFRVWSRAAADTVDTPAKAPAPAAKVQVAAAPAAAPVPPLERTGPNTFTATLDEHLTYAKLTEHQWGYIERQNGSMTSEAIAEHLDLPLFVVKHVRRYADRYRTRFVRAAPPPHPQHTPHTR